MQEITFHIRCSVLMHYASDINSKFVFNFRYYFVPTSFSLCILNCSFKDYSLGILCFIPLVYFCLITLFFSLYFSYFNCFTSHLFFYFLLYHSTLLVHGFDPPPFYISPYSLYHIMKKNLLLPKILLES